MKNIIIMNMTQTNNANANGVVNLHNAFADYKGMLFAYLENLTRTTTKDIELLRVGYDILLMNETEQKLFMMYILEFWYDYTLDLLNGYYKYVHLTKTVYTAWAECMKEE